MKGGAPLLQELPSGRLAFVGDVHGELDALHSLLRILSNESAHHLVFLGDLVDRGPDSAGCVHLVRELVETGRATCLMGNHELNLLRL